MAMAIALGVADAAASSAAVGGGTTLYLIASGIVIVAAGFAVWTRSRYRVLAALPILLSLDNLSTPLRIEAAGAAGLASCALAGVGFVVAAIGYARLPDRHHRGAALAIAALAVVAIVQL
jgi:hypothetical protein